MAEPISYAYTANGVFVSYDGLHYEVGANVFANIASLGSTLVINATTIVIGNSSTFNTINALAWTGSANSSANSQPPIYGNSTTNVTINSTAVFIGNSTVNVTINSTFSGGTGNGSSANLTGYINTATIVANVAILTSNNANNLGGFAANQYAFANAFANALANSTAYFQAGITANVALTATVVAKIPLSLENFDIGSHYDNTTNYRWTPPAGPVVVTGSAYFVASSGNLGDCELYIFKNGAAVEADFNLAPGAVQIGLSVSFVDKANGTDYYELWAYSQVTGIVRQSGTPYTIFSGASLVGPTGANGATGATGAAVNTSFIDVCMTANTSMPTSTFTLIPFDTKNSDVTNSYSTSTGKYIPQVAGNYLVTASLYYNSNVAFELISLYKNGAEIHRGSQSGEYIASLSFIVPMNGTTDYLQIYGRQDSGSTTVIEGTGATVSQLTCMQAVLLPGSTAGPTGATGAAVNTGYMSCYSNAVISGIPGTGAVTAVAFPVVESDAYGTYNSSTGHYTPTVAGNYQINAALYFNTSTGLVAACVMKNGAEFRRGSQFAVTTSSQATVSCIVPMNGTTDYLQIGAIQTSGSANSIGYSGGTNVDYFNVQLIPGSTAGPTGATGPSGSTPANSAITFPNTQVGYVVSNTGLYSAVSNGTAGTATSITLFPGVWDLEAVFKYSGSGSTTTTNLYFDIDTTAGTISSALGIYAAVQNRYNGGSGFLDVSGQNAITRQRVTITSNTTYYANCRWDGTTPASYAMNALLRATLC